jgi:2-oxo-4-hydroxy-4-carboxy-5-ureidoimidazoline decarboxylase
MADAPTDAAAFDRLSSPAAQALLRPACASDAWLTALAAGRPYGSVAAVQARSDEVLAGLGWPDVEQALQAHPRIGDRPAGTGTEAGWSREEQSAATGSAGELRAGNLEYEERFGQVFLICATGRTAEQILAALRARLGNDPETERAVVRAELAKIVRLRLAKTLT